MPLGGGLGAEPRGKERKGLGQGEGKAKLGDSSEVEAALGGGFDEDNGAAHEDSFLCGARGWPESSDTALPPPPARWSQVSGLSLPHLGSNPRASTSSLKAQFPPPR